ncbi:MAG: hypothetical protein JHC93_02165 [Parachlamydiales bacterium]|nr:hypothetical protein [Parachlamydiales bacterium]
MHINGVPRSPYGGPQAEINSSIKSVKSEPLMASLNFLQGVVYQQAASVLTHLLKNALTMPPAVFQRQMDQIRQQVFQNTYFREQSQIIFSRSYKTEGVLGLDPKIQAKFLYVEGAHSSDPDDRRHKQKPSEEDEEGLDSDEDKA